jgi:hypothetical protein
LRSREQQSALQPFSLWRADNLAGSNRELSLREVLRSGSLRQPDRTGMKRYF